MIIKAKALREKTIVELKTELFSVYKERLSLCIQKKMRPETFKPNLLKNAKKYIARLKTVLKELGADVNSF